MQAQLSEEQIYTLLRGFGIPSQPQILVDLKMAQASGQVDLQEIGRLIRKDIYVSGSVLKVANSPFYGLRNPVTSIEHALMMIGTLGVINIVNAVTLRQELVLAKNLSDDDTQFLNRFWDSAEDTARVAAVISRELDLGQPDELYLLGLFNNAGIPLMLERFRDYRKVLSQSYELTEGSVTRMENHHYETNHAVLGYYLTRSWKMPKLICDSIGQHHNLQTLFADASHHGSPLLNNVTIMKMAEHIVGLFAILAENQTDREWTELQTPILDYLNLTTDDLDDLTQQCRDLGIIDQVQAA
jgi:HD-like signal output (HDOD) protein